MLKKLKINKEKKEKKIVKSKSGIRKSTYVLVILDICAALCFCLFYGPFSGFRDLYVTTAMDTGHHKYLAQIFYSSEGINEILSNNAVIAAGDSSDASQVTVGDIDTSGNYASVYEQQILEREEGEDYKLIRIEENSYSGYLVVIYDPSRIELHTSRKLSVGGQLPTVMAEETDATVLINASGFSRSSSGKIVPHGTTIQDGKIISVGNNRSGGTQVGFTEDDVLVIFKNNEEDIAKYDIRDAVYFGPALVVDGEASYITGTAGGLQPRTAIGQRKDGIVLFLVVDGRSVENGIGANYADLAKIFIRYGAYNASNLDGGGSASLVVNGELTNNPCGNGSCAVPTERYIPNAWVFK